MESPLSIAGLTAGVFCSISSKTQAQRERSFIPNMFPRQALKQVGRI